MQSPKLKESMMQIPNLQEILYAWNIVLVRQALAVPRNKAEELARQVKEAFEQDELFEFYFEGDKKHQSEY